MNVCGDAAGTVAHGRGNTSHFRGRWGQDSANNIESVDNSEDSLHFVHSTDERCDTNTDQVCLCVL